MNIESVYCSMNLSQPSSVWILSQHITVPTLSWPITDWDWPAQHYWGQLAQYSRGWAQLWLMGNLWLSCQPEHLHMQHGRKILLFATVISLVRVEDWPKTSTYAAWPRDIIICHCHPLGLSKKCELFDTAISSVQEIHLNCAAWPRDIIICHCHPLGPSKKCELFDTAISSVQEIHLNCELYGKRDPHIQYGRGIGLFAIDIQWSVIGHT